MEERLDFGAELARLEEIVRQLEGEDLDLDDALRLFEDGVARLRRARERLAAAELRVRQVLGEGSGAPRVEPFDG